MPRSKRRKAGKDKVRKEREALAKAGKVRGFAPRRYYDPGKHPKPSNPTKGQ